MAKREQGTSFLPMEAEKKSFFWFLSCTGGGGICTNDPSHLDPEPTPVTLGTATMKASASREHMPRSSVYDEPAFSYTRRTPLQPNPSSSSNSESNHNPEEAIDNHNGEISETSGSAIYRFTPPPRDQLFPLPGWRHPRDSVELDLPDPYDKVIIPRISLDAIPHQLLPEHLQPHMVPPTPVVIPPTPVAPGPDSDVGESGSGFGEGSRSGQAGGMEVPRRPTKAERKASRKAKKKVEKLEPGIELQMLNK